VELILAVLAAGPIGYIIRNRRTSLLVYLAAWVVVFPIQSAVVGLFDDFDPLYFVVNAVILCLGIGLNRLGSVLRERRSGRQGAAAHASR
jgi:hypothetical protein